MTDTTLARPSLVRSMVRNTLAPTRNDIDTANLGRLITTGYNTDTPERAAFRGLLDSAAILGATVRVGFFKIATAYTPAELRYMVAAPILLGDCTRQYYTVQDLELSEQQNRRVYRRINLDTVAALQIDYRAAE